MASGENRSYRTHGNRSLSDNDIENRIQRREYSERETYIPPRNTVQHFQARPDMLPNVSQIQLNDDETSSQTRLRLADLQAEIAKEEDSTTIVRSPSLPSPRQGPSTREQIEKSEEKLRFIHARKGEIAQLFETMKHLQTVDLCFLVDCTGSMDPYIAQVKEKIDHLVEHCKMTFADLVLKVAFIGYRDHGDKERIIFLPFTGEIAYFKSFVSKIQADGGDDAAEDVFGGLEEAGKLQWSAPIRILFHVADAPCHGRQYHDDVLDYYPNGDPRSLNAEDLLKVLEDKRIKYWFAKLTDKTDKMITEFSRLMRTSTIQQVKLESAEQLMFAVADSVSSSICDMETATLAAAALNAFSRDYNTCVPHPRAGVTRSLKTFTIDETIPDWKLIPVENAYMFRNKLPSDMANADLKQPLEEECRGRRIQIARQPFAKGAQRIVYYGIDCSHVSPKKVVFKEFMYLGKGLNTLKSYKQQMEIQSISAFLAQEFNRRKPKEAKDILFTKVVVISLYDRSKPFYCSQEPLIEGPYVKYNSNNGFVNKDEYAASLNAFSHWTYQITNGYLMVVDLQGVTTTTSTVPKFTLTDPALHCKDLTRFCSTNLGSPGMHRFFRTHHCNSICKAMNLELHRHQPKPSSMMEKGTLSLT